MQGVGQRLKERARALGWTDAEVARRLGMGQNRYANYVSDTREPDFATFVRICRVLGTRPDVVLGLVPEAASDEDDEMRRTLGALAQALSGNDLKTLVRVAEALAPRSSPA